MPSRDDDIETMPARDLLTLPSDNIPPGVLTMLWARHSAVIYQRRIEELNLELSGAYTRHVLLYPGHKIRNVLDELPEDQRGQTLNLMRAAWRVKTAEEGEKAISERRPQTRMSRCSKEWPAVQEGCGCSLV